MQESVCLTEAMTGRSSPDPLRYAFDRKTGAHSGGGNTSVPPDQSLQVWNDLMSRKGEGKRAAYFHIPFCKTKCSYCGFFQNTTRSKLVDNFVNQLVLDIERTAQTENAQSTPIHAVYFGGGTPTDLEPQQIQRLGEVIHRNLPLTNDCEITFESRFNGLTDEKISAIVDAGFNRVSLGVQTFDTFIRRKMSRIDSQEFLLDRLEKLTATDQLATVVDLIFGLPYQTMESWMKDLEMMVQTGIDGVDLYQLILMGHTRMAQSIAKGSMPQPAGISEKSDMFSAAVEYLDQQHFRRLSVSHWGKGSRERNVYNHLAKSGADMLCFGSGAGGKIDGHGIMLNRTLDGYGEAIERHQKPIMGISRPHSLYKALYAAAAAFDLGYLDLKKMDQAGFSFSEHCQPLFQAWENNGLAIRKGNFIDLTLAGQFWAINMNQGLHDYVVQFSKLSTILNKQTATAA
ncbi:heme anaerobic degradation radical SAM methyltransferase ChuW/HutW [Endozoicomonas sp. OPT23]|uniref:heme anaerobic degradation radical SAM methyltransferase ChuW/HutW n=1 Tax=Endozoicomonas sp. OPT23 TaxID=2072845 RepID=UPI00129A3A7A|nr:heme anaerobic degradation radical SAM methyltransferase ChuW/HutW [Endozoicomonas sp. OPT23]MRI33083.1 heme anaerobic degradation radical SAM methyltransferase ChuW/HutW [Endozoicomonas sp. OPT23]